PALEAVKIDRAQRAISIATLGQAAAADLETMLATELRRLQQMLPGSGCALLSGEADCGACDIALPGEVQAKLTVHQDRHTVTIARVTCPTARGFWRWRDLPWPKLVPRQVSLPDEEDHEREWKPQLLAAGLCGAFGLAAYLIGTTLAAELLYPLAYLAGGWFALHEVWVRWKQWTLDVHFLMVAVALGSASIGAWGEGTTLLFLFALSGALEHYAMGRTQREIRSLFQTAPKVATRLDEQGREQESPVDRLQPGMRLRLKPGEQFPVDGEILKGATAVDESNLTGEATPVEKGLGDPVMAGTLNLWGVVEVKVLRPADRSALQKIIHLIREAQHLKAPSQRFTDRFGTRYTYAILGLSAAMFLLWWLGAGRSPFAAEAAHRSAFYQTMTLLVVASPCALVLSIPSAILAAIAWAARHGILFRGGAAVEKLAAISVVAMDKTGTLTTGELRVERVESFPPGREAEVLELAYALERLSTHPLARAISRFGKQQQVRELELDQFESVTGLGLRAVHGVTPVVLGRREWLAHGPHRARIQEVPATEPGASEVWLARDRLLGRILLRDDVRPQASAVVARLRKLGLQMVVLTGDRRPAAEHLRLQLGLEDVRAELKPEEKVQIIAGFSRERRHVAMIGDGVNDAPSLAAAYVGVAMGARGSDAALEQAEVVLMHDRLENFLAAYQLSQRSRRIIRQNVTISLGTVVVLVGCALFGAIPLTLGVLGHEGSTVIVVLNSLRLLVTGPDARLPRARSRH
ncbi:MAG: heavy metal translocating P-type ATPase, partial [Verrucomicrobia bacterium]|nr:heavy metal translocating P-type ATPase [Verrucomicrobiota bacterium]